MRLTSLLGLAALAAASSLSATPASAQYGGYPLYPWCALYGGGRGGGGSNCGFSNRWQCEQAVSGTGGMCVVNSWYAAYGPYYSFGGAPLRRRGRW
jgi:hypothetical protein